MNNFCTNCQKPGIIYVTYSVDDPRYEAQLSDSATYLIPVENQLICEECTALFRCRICHMSVFPYIRRMACVDCWDTLGISKITDTLYLSDSVVARNYDELKKLGIKQILTIGAELEPHKHPDFDAIHIKIHDCHTVDISKYFNTAFEFIRRAPTLVHCYAGISRSATLVISYLMREKNMSYSEALEYCIKARPVVNPNQGFVNKLKILEIYMQNNIDLSTLGPVQIDLYKVSKKE